MSNVNDLAVLLCHAANVCASAAAQARGRTRSILFCSALYLYDDLRSQFTELFAGMSVSHDGAIPRQTDDIMKMVMNEPCGCPDVAAFWRSMAVFLVKCKAQRDGAVGMGET